MSSKQRRRRAARSAGAAAARAAEQARSAPSPTNQRSALDHQQRDLHGTGASHVSAVRALRARDLNRPTAQDLAEAEASVVIVRRHWQPGS